jgi:hypothetical protein
METTLMKNMADFDTDVKVIQFVKTNKHHFDFKQIDKLIGKQPYKNQPWSYHFFDNVIFVQFMTKRTTEQNQNIVHKLEQSILIVNKN